MLQEYLEDTFKMFRDELIPLAKIILSVVVPAELVRLVITPMLPLQANNFTHQMLPGMVLDQIAHPLYAAGVIIYIASVVAGERKTVWQSLYLGSRLWAPFFFLYLVVNVMTLFGFAMLIIPGIIVAVRMSLAQFELVLNGRSVSEAISLSWRKTGAPFWTLFGGFFVITFLAMLPVLFLLELMVAAVPNFALLKLLAPLVIVVLAALYPIFAFRMFVELGRKPTEQ